MKRLIFLILILIGKTSLCQNLVLNPSMEDTIPCSSFTNIGPQMRPYYWFKPTNGSSDFFNTIPWSVCGWGGGVPSNNFGYQYPHSYNSYLGFLAFDLTSPPPHPSSREYISGTLSDSLVAGHNYNVSFYVSAANFFKLVTDDIGFYFLNDSIHIDTMGVLGYIPQIENLQGNILNDTLNWMLIQGNYIAQGGEKYFIIGNFKDDANTTIDSIQAQGNQYAAGYYYLDDVTVIDCTLVNVTEIKSEINFTLTPNPATEKITVTSSSKIKSVSVVNVLGEIVIQKQFNESANKIVLDVGILPKGIYFLKYVTEKGNAIKKFVKM